MQVKVRFLENLRLEASFDDFTVISDQPIRYEGDGTAPGPFDYFLASSALCAAYFVEANRCTVKRVIQNDLGFKVDSISVLGKSLAFFMRMTLKPEPKP